MRFRTPGGGIFGTCVFTLLAAANVAQAATISVPAGGNLQAALNAAQPGDVITLEPGATYIGNFLLPNKGAITDYITLRSAAPDNVLPPPGRRMTPAYAALLPKIKSPNSVSALRTAAAANHWKLMFLEFQANMNGSGDIIALGVNDSTQTQLSQVPYALVLDRVYIHGDPLVGQKRGISLNSRDTAVINSYVSECKAVGQDSQAIGGFNGPGNYLIENNYLEGAGENVLFGGADPQIPDLVTSHVTVRRNYMRKPIEWRDPIVATPVGAAATAAPGAGSLTAGTYYYKVVARGVAGKATSAPSTEVSATLPAGTQGGVTISWTPVVGAEDYLVYGRTAGSENIYWKTSSAYFSDSGAAGTSGTPSANATKWSVKNTFELKNAQDVLIEGNVFEKLWVADQPGFPIVFTPRNQSGTAPWVVVQRVMFRHNIIRHTAGGVNILGTDNLAPSRRTNNITIYNNLFDDMTASIWGSARAFQLGAGPDATTIDHNTVITTNSTIVWFYGGPATSPTQITNTRITNNVSAHNTYGITGSNYSTGTSAIAAYMPDGTVQGNVLAGGSALKYPAGNLFPAVSAWQSAFANYAAGDYRLVAECPYKAAATDGLDPGADIDRLMVETAGAVTGDNTEGPDVDPLRIMTTSLPNGTLHEPYAQLVSCAGGSGNLFWRIRESRLPAGVTFDSVAGLIVGTPASVETGSITLELNDRNDPTRSVTETLTLTVDPPPFLIDVPVAAAGRVGIAYQLTPSVSGALGTVTWTLASGALPEGVALDAFTGKLSGVPLRWGSTTAGIEARDSWRPDRIASKPVTITIAPEPLSIATASLPVGLYGTAYRADLQSTGGTGSTSWSLAGGTLPAGLTLDVKGAVSGVPTSVGSTSFTVNAVDVSWPGNSAAATLSLTVDAPVFLITLPAPAPARVGQPYQLTPAATGNLGPVIWSISSGSLPAGLRIDSSTGAITGTPTAWGTSTLSVKATDSWSADRTQVRPLTIEVAPVALAISTSTLPAGVYNTAYGATLTASGGTGTVTWSLLSGALPNGLTLNATSGAITGTPTAIGSFGVAVKAVDSAWNSETATRNLTLVIAAAPFTVAVPAVSSGRVGLAYSAVATATGQVGTVVWSLASGSLPPGVSLNSASGVIAGTPSAFGTFSAIIQGRDSWSAARVASGSMTISIAPAVLVITTSSLPSGTYRATYKATLTAGGGTGITTWSIASGALPTGLTLSSSGVISGKPMTAGTFSFTVRALDAGWTGNVATKAFTIKVVAREIVLYAVDATRIGGAWSLVSDTTAAAGKRLWNPNRGAPKLTAALAAPAHYFDITFAAEAGIAYHLWVRGKAENDYWGSDSVMVQFSNSVNSDGTANYRIGTTSAHTVTVTLEDCVNCGLSGWGWQDNGFGTNVLGPAIYFDRTGPQTIRVQVREDGFSIDQIVMSAARYLTVSPGALKNDTTILPR